MESLARIVQRSRAAASGSATHAEAKTSADFALPPTCTSTRRDEPFVLFDGVTDEGSRLIVFSTEQNLRILAEHPNWIVDGTFYICPRIFQQRYSIHAVIAIDGKCISLVFALLNDKTYLRLKFSNPLDTLLYHLTTCSHIPLPRSHIPLAHISCIGHHLSAAVWTK